MSLRLKFFLAFLLLTSIPLLILQFGAVERMEQEITQRTETELHTTLDKMAGELDLILNNQKSIAIGLANVPAVKHFSAKNVQSIYKNSPRLYKKHAEELEQFFLNYQHVVTSIQALRYIDSSGKTLVKVKEGKPIEARRYDPGNNRMFVADQSNRQFYKSAMVDKKRVTMSNFELGQVMPGADFCPAMIRYSVPIKDELDNIEGILVVNMWGRRLDSTLEAALGGYPGKVYLAELSNDSFRDGIYLYNKDTQKRFANQLGTDHHFSNEFTPEEWKKIKASSRNGSIFKDDGRMFFYRSISPYPGADTKWLLVIEAASDLVLAPIRNMRKWIWGLLIILLLASLVVSIWAAFQFAKPVRALAALITHYADGDHSIRYDGHRRDEIGLAGRAFNYLVACLEKAEKERDQAKQAICQSERLASIGQLAAGIGHEINNPLMNITSLAALVEDSIKDKDEQVTKDLQLLQTEVQRCAHIVQGILNFAKENKPTFKGFDMSALISETLSLLHHRIESAEINLVTQVHSPLNMHGDPNMLQQVLVNILLNAIQASPAKSNIIISVTTSEYFINIEILDNGEGIQKNHVSKVFDPFFSTKQEGDGTGLGLSVSYGIIKRHGGTINIENIENPKGVKVTIILPVKGPAAGENIDRQALELVDDVNETNTNGALHVY